MQGNLTSVHLCKEVPKLLVSQNVLNMSNNGDQEGACNVNNNETNAVGSTCDDGCIANVGRNRNYSKSSTKEGLTKGSLSDEEPEKKEFQSESCNDMDSKKKSTACLYQNVVDTLISIARSTALLHEGNEVVPKLSSGGRRRSVSITKELQLLLFLMIISPSLGCPSADIILNPPQPMIGKLQTISCSYQLKLCDHGYWYFNGIPVSASDGYNISGIRYCTGSISFYMSSTHEFGNITCAMEGSSNGERKNCSTSVHLPGIPTAWPTIDDHDGVDTAFNRSYIAGTNNDTEVNLMVDEIEDNDTLILLNDTSNGHTGALAASAAVVGAAIIPALAVAIFIIAFCWNHIKK